MQDEKVNKDVFYPIQKLLSLSSKVVFHLVFFAIRFSSLVTILKAREWEDKIKLVESLSSKQLD